MSSLVIGTRGSALALWQARYIQARLKHECHIESSISIIKTQGDKILDVPLAKIGGKGLFTKELEEKLLSKEIDLAVHSLKDVPVDFVGNLALAAITEREDYRDSFLSMAYADFDSLPKGAKVGTTSLRRSMQIKKLRPDLDTLSLRGNVQTRLKRLEEGEFDAIILAQAGIKRLGLDTTDVKYITPLAFMIPAMGQGALGIEMCKDHIYFDKIASLTHEPTALCVSAERAFVQALNGGCQVPIGVHAQYNDKKLSLQAIVGLPDGSEYIQESVQECLAGEALDNINAAQSLAQSLAQSFINKGAKELLNRAQDMAFR